MNERVDQHIYVLITGDGINTSLSRSFYLVLYTGASVVHLSLYLAFVRYQVPYVLGAHDELYINYVYLYISTPYINPNMNSTPVREC